MADPVPGTGIVYLVGAGPGDPGLVTLRAVRCLERADAVLYDYLVNPAILRHAPESAARICLGKHGQARVWSQGDINARMVQLALEGKVVVRLKGGDPSIFAHGAEEAETLASHNIPFEIVPGITAALAAGSCAGIALTHREFASAVALVTGQEDSEKGSSALDYDALAHFPGTLVFYMGVTTVGVWTSELMRAGKQPETPAVILRRCSWPDQVSIRCRLDEVAERITSARLRPPVIVIVGRVAGLAPALAWFEQRPLFGQKIVVTRPVDQSSALGDRLAELGADVIVQPAIQIGPPRDWSPVDAALESLDRYDWLVFSSSNGIRFFFQRLLSTGRDLRSLAGVKIAAIGPGTSAELDRFHLRADVQPAEYRAEALASALSGNAPGRRFLLVRASRGREVLAEQLSAAGGFVEQVVVYSSVDVTTPEPLVVHQLQSGHIDWVTVTSSAIARSLVAMFGDDLRRARLASISPITTGTLRELGHEPSAEATEYTMPGVVAAIVRSTNRGG